MGGGASHPSDAYGEDEKQIHETTSNSDKNPQAIFRKPIKGMNEDFAIALVLPVYYTNNQITEPEVELLTEVWDSIAQNKAEFFRNLKKEAAEKNESFPYETCADYFASLFYQNLFVTIPGSKNLFHHSKIRMRVYFMASISILLDEILEDPAKFTHQAEIIARIHNSIGVKAFECKYLLLYRNCFCFFLIFICFLDGLGCEIVMQSIRKCVGPTVYSPAVSDAWIKFFSRFLDAILPQVIRFEHDNPSSSAMIYEKRKQIHHEDDITANTSELIKSLHPIAKKP